jgi:hypothetical protein
MARHPRVLGLGDRSCRGVDSSVHSFRLMTGRDLLLGMDVRKGGLAATLAAVCHVPNLLEAVSTPPNFNSATPP